MNGQVYKVTAFYDTREGAETGASILKDNGISSSDIDIVHGEEGTEHAGSEGGFMNKLSNMFMPDEDRHAYAEGVGRGGYVLSVDVSEADHQRVVELLDTDHTVDMDERSGSWKQEGWSGRNEAMDAGAAGTASTQAALDTTSGGTDGQHVDVVEEQLKVGKREVSHGRMRVRSYTVSEDVSADVTLESQTAEVERHKVDRTLTGADADAAFQDKEIVVEERAEEAVVSKEAHVVEEIEVRKDVDRETKTVTDTVRRTEVDIEREGDRDDTRKGS